MSSPLDKLIDANVGCAICGARPGSCGCWWSCAGCAISVQRGRACRLCGAREGEPLPSDWTAVYDQHGRRRQVRGFTTAEEAAAFLAVGLDEGRCFPVTVLDPDGTSLGRAESLALGYRAIGDEDAARDYEEREQ